MKSKYFSTSTQQGFLIIFGEPIPEMFDKLDAFRGANLKQCQENEEFIEKYNYINELSFYKASGLSEIGDVLLVILGELLNNESEMRMKFMKHIDSV